MIKMNNNNDFKNDFPISNQNNNISYIIPLSKKKERTSLFVNKAKDYMKNKKAISMRQIFNDGKNIKKNFDIPKTEQSDEKEEKMNTFILGYGSEKQSDKNNKLMHSILEFKTKSKSRSNGESSCRIQKMIEKNSRIDLTNDKKEKFLDFYINDNKKNKIYNLDDNTITTTKYNLLTFIPKGLLFQFFRLSNVYFLFTAIIQSIPLISPLTSVTAIIPLIFVLGVSMIREFIEDWTRKTYDDLNNREEVVVYRDGSFKREYSQSLRIGEILIIPEGRTIPADMVLIDSGLRDGIAYVETSSLDGEKALKFKLSNKMTVGIFSEDNNKREINFRNLEIRGDIEICPPNQNLNEISGMILYSFL